MILLITPHKRFCFFIHVTYLLNISLNQSFVYSFVAQLKFN